MGVHPWPMIDPATSYLTMTTGPGAVPMQLYSYAMTTHGVAVDDVVLTSGANAAVTFTPGVFQGLGADAAQAALTTHNVDNALLSEVALMKAQLANAAGELHTFTVPRMVTHVQANANRMEYVADNAINPWVLGALTQRLIELELEYYGYMWTNNAQAGVGYGAGLDGLGAALAALSALPSLAGGSPAAAALAAGQVAQTAGITGLSAAMSTTEQAATALISPAAATTSSATTSMLGNTPLAAPSATPVGAAPMANVQAHANPTLPPLTQAQAPVMGMFAPPPSAAITPPAPAPTTAPPVQTLTPGAGPGTGAPGVTSFVKPTQPFAPPPMPGRAARLAPGMLNAAALRGPVNTLPLITTTATATAPLTTTATSTLATASQPLAYVPPEPPRPTVPPTPPQPPLLNSGDTAHTLNPPPPPTQLLTPPPPAPQPAAPQSGPPGPSTGAGDPSGSGGPGAQMLGTGPGGAPLAPQFPIPLDPTPPVPPPPMPPIEDMDRKQAIDAWNQLNDDWANYNTRCPVDVVGPLPPGPYSACLARTTS